MTNEIIEKIREDIKASGAELSHTSTQAGYISKKNYRVDAYQGRFGRGYILHLPSVFLSPFRSRRFHPVEYWIIPVKFDE